jgi:hypothetical protein
MHFRFASAREFRLVAAPRVQQRWPMADANNINRFMADSYGQQSRECQTRRLSFRIALHSAALETRCTIST